MPVKLRQSKQRQHRITPEALEAFQRGDAMGLHRALGLKPWQPSPFDIDGPEPPTWASPGPWRDSWPMVAGLLAELKGTNTQ